MEVIEDYETGKIAREHGPLVAQAVKRDALENHLPRGFVPAAEYFLREFGGKEYNAEVKAALAELKKANDAPNPIYVWLRNRFGLGRGLTPEQQKQVGRGLTQDQAMLVGAYIQSRTETTVGDIAALIYKLIRSYALDLGGGVLPNLTDELRGPRHHLDMLNESIAQMCETVGARHADQTTYPMIRQALTYQEEYGRLPTTAELFALSRKTASGTLNRVTMDDARKALELAILFPPEANGYGDWINALNTEDLAHPNDLMHVCGAAIGLALRESSSGSLGGVIGIWKTNVEAHQGYFTPGEYRGVSDYHVAHIGKQTAAEKAREDAGVYTEATHKGAEDAHEKQATMMAVFLMDYLLHQDPVEGPKAVAAMLRQSAKTCDIRNAHAQSFVDAIERASEREGVRGSYQEPTGEGTRMRERAVNSAKDEIPILPGKCRNAMPAVGQAVAGVVKVAKAVPAVVGGAAMIGAAVVPGGERVADFAMRATARLYGDKPSEQSR